MNMASVARLIIALAVLVAAAYAIERLILETQCAKIGKQYMGEYQRTFTKYNCGSAGIYLTH